MRNRILFVDDEVVVLESLERLLYRERDAWEMHFQSDPEAAWQTMTERDFDAVVLDVRMPGTDGLELMARMAANPKTHHVPVIFLTGEADRALKSRALDDGATDFLASGQRPRVERSRPIRSSRWPARSR